MSKLFCIVVAGVGLFAGAHAVAAAEPAAPAKLISQDDVIGITVKQSLIAAAKAGNGPFDIATAEAIERGYEQHGNVPIWVDANGYNPKALTVIEELKRANDWGLATADYAVPMVKGAGLSNVKLAEAELVLTRAVVHYSHDAHVGRFDPARISELIDLMSTPPDAAAVLSGLVGHRPVGIPGKFQPAPSRIRAAAAEVPGVARQSAGSDCGARSRWPEAAAR